MRLTAEQTRAFVRAVAAPVLLVLANGGPFADRPIYREMLALFRSIEVVRLDGGHHLHLEGGETDVAARVAPFFGLAPRQP